MFKSVHDILNSLEQKAKWQEQPFQILVRCWAEVVGTVVAGNTRPLSIQRDVLSVATSSAAWAQNLTFSRQTLLLKLNQKLATPLVDIRFSTAEWKTVPLARKQEPIVSPQSHPSYVGQEINFGFRRGENASEAFASWAKAMQERSHSLPLCPVCQCPTPPGELQRWNVCSLCCSKQSINH
ncbi:DciA family protein [Cronbergia sp. UHCC 0137]|uniref:DUF721 domain-containing protein n=1 Tax=Cronbergia sp. UHCC 0137 TaxID=3110239 RepID=UPI002B21C197|nr:DciA family protein [Cronbergia sp. UHCC 0137]MEA5616763.1 DciA family protein [Cronbergia sp. UHCC 0137]